MNRKQFVILLVLVAVLGAAGLLVHRRGQQSWQDAGQSIGLKLLPDLSVNDIGQITITAGANKLDLAKVQNTWRVRERGDYPADFSHISELLMKFADLKIAQAEEIGPSQLGRFELLPPGAGAGTGTQVDFKDAGGKAGTSVLLGKKHMKKPAGNAAFAGMGDEGWADGRYAMVGSKTLAVVSDALENVEPKPEVWLNKEFLHVEKPRSIAVQFPEATNSWKLTRRSETNDWQLAEAAAAEKLDNSKISGVTAPFSSASFNDVLPGDTRPEISGLTNLTSLTVETFDGFTYSLKLGPKHNEVFPMTVNVNANLPGARGADQNEPPADKSKLDADFKGRQTKLSEKLANEKKFEGWIYLLPADNVEPILKPRSQLLSESNSSPPEKTGK